MKNTWKYTAGAIIAAVISACIIIKSTKKRWIKDPVSGLWSWEHPDWQLA